MARPALPSNWQPRAVAAMHARCIGKVEDRGPNRGQLCDYVQVRAGGSLGEYYCADTVVATFTDEFGHASPLILSGSCEQQRQRAIAKDAYRTRAEFEAARARDPLSVLGWVGLCIGPDDEGKPHAHHAFLIGCPDPLTGAQIVNGPRGGFLICEGNAADPKIAASRNGDGIYAGRERGHPDDHTEYGFIDPAAFPL